MCFIVCRYVIDTSNIISCLKINRMVPSILAHFSVVFKYAWNSCSRSPLSHSPLSLSPLSFSSLSLSLLSLSPLSLSLLSLSPMSFSPLSLSPSSLSPPSLSPLSLSQLPLNHKRWLEFLFCRFVRKIISQFWKN